MASLDYACLALDHYHDHRQSQIQARETGNKEVLNLFQMAQLMLLATTSLIVITLAQCPLDTTITTACVTAPAFLWDITLFTFNYRGKEEPVSIKRIPGIKPILVGIVRGFGTYSIVSSILQREYTYIPIYPWNAGQIVVWVTINRACHAVSSTHAHCHLFLRSSTNS